MLIVIVIKHFAACGSPCTAAPFSGGGATVHRLCAWQQHSTGFEKKGQEFISRDYSNQLSRNKQPRRSDEIHFDFKTNLAFMYFFHGRFSIHFACGSRCVNYRWSNDDFIIIDTLPEKKAKKFG